MSGEQLKKKLLTTGIPIAEIARMAGMTSQHINQALNVADIKTGFIEKLSVILEHPISWFYGETSTVGDLSQNSNSFNNLPEGIIALLQKKDEQIDRLLTIIEKMK